jgi:hypothetical protein
MWICSTWDFSLFDGRRDSNVEPYPSKEAVSAFAALRAVETVLHSNPRESSQVELIAWKSGRSDLARNKSETERVRT